QSKLCCQNAFLLLAFFKFCKNSVSVRWVDADPQVDPSLLRLCNWPPTQISVKSQGSEAVFYAEFWACNIRRLVSSVKNFRYSSLVKSNRFLNALNKKWSNNFLFVDDFSGVATTTTFSLGSTIPIAASVAQQNHQPLILLLDGCLASTTPELGPDSHVYPLITNNGCLVDSKNTNSRFLPRKQLSEIRLSLEAFKFVIGEDASSFVHSEFFFASSPGLPGLQACGMGPNWVLIDDPSQNSLCSCCDTNCQGRKKLGITAALNSVIGPLVIIEN
uniref:Zona pellucida glycoprotein 3f, tandem duplicate 1 n=1 Tax=Sinocyclocheilus grahami TaxID=75366 RepID=A0A672L6P9_SINGR